MLHCLICFIKLCGKLFTIKFHIIEFLCDQVIKFLMLLRKLGQFLIGFMDIILIIHLLKLAHSTVMTEMLLLLFRLLRVSLLGPRVFNLILSKFRVCSYDRLTLINVLTS